MNAGPLGYLKPPPQRMLRFGCLVLAVLTVCAVNRAQLARAAPPVPAQTAASLPYQVHCPDVVEITVARRPDLSGVQRVGADGRISLGQLGRLRIEGYTTAEIAELLAQAIQTSRDRVAVRVVEYNSQHVYLFGQVKGAQRPVAYQGGEPVVHLLQRVGGIAPGAEPTEIYVVRPRLSSGRPPEVFHVELRDIVSGHDQRTNLMVQPFDEIHVGRNAQVVFLQVFASMSATVLQDRLRHATALLVGDSRLGSVSVKLEIRSTKSETNPNSKSPMT